MTTESSNEVENTTMISDNAWSEPSDEAMNDMNSTEILGEEREQPYCDCTLEDFTTKQLMDALERRTGR